MASAATHLAMEWKACGRRRKMERVEKISKLKQNKFGMFKGIVKQDRTKK